MRLRYMSTNQLTSLKSEGAIVQYDDQRWEFITLEPADNGAVEVVLRDENTLEEHRVEVGREDLDEAIWFVF